MHVETRYFFIFENILITAKNFRNRRKVLLTTIFYKSSGTFNETWTLILLAYNIFSKNSWFLFLDKSQVQNSVDFTTCFSCTVKEQNIKSIQAHSWTPPPHPFQCYHLFIYTISICIICGSQEERTLIPSNEQIYTFYELVIF